MELNKRQSLARKRINSLRSAIQKTIDEFCENENKSCKGVGNEVSYPEVNASILKVLGDNNDDLLSGVWVK